MAFTFDEIELREHRGTPHVAKTMWVCAHAQVCVHVCILVHLCIYIFYFMTGKYIVFLELLTETYIRQI
jgi:hypothetical protein